MSGSESQDPGDGALSPFTDQPETFDLESLLLELTKTKTGTDSLAKALRNRHTRQVLKQRGFKIQADDDIGYNSLPLELRDHIREYFIAIMQRPQDLIFGWGRCPRLAPYACIDSEWRDAVESVTFKSLDLARNITKVDKDLRRFERYVVERRRQYLQHIFLPIVEVKVKRGENNETDGPSEENKVDAFIKPIRKLFSCLERWAEYGTGNGNLRIEFQNKTGALWMGQSFSVPLEQLCVGLTKLPTTPQITHFCVPLWEPLDVGSILVLLSRMPNLRSITILLTTVDLDLLDDTRGYRSQIQLFFDSLPRTVPNLEALEVACNYGRHIDNFQAMFCTSALSYSQRLCKFSLTYIDFATLRSVLAPFSTANFDSEAPPSLVWPNLTKFTVGKMNYFQERRDDVTTVINEMTLAVGRAVRYMPRIQNLEMELTYTYFTDEDGDMGFICHYDSSMVFNLESFPHFGYRSPLARLSVTHNNPGLDLAETVPSEEARDLWEKSLSHATGAVLEIQAVSKQQEAGFVSGEITEEDSDED